VPSSILIGAFSPCCPIKDRVNQIWPFPDGRLLIAGVFRNVNGVARNGLAVLNADGSLDQSFRPDGSMRNIVNGVLQADGKILVGIDNGSTTLNGVWRLNSDGSIDTSFQRSVVAAVVMMTIQPDQQILVSTSNELIRLLPDGRREAEFRLRPGGTEYLGTVKSMQVQAEGKIIVGGDFVATGQSGQPGIRIRHHLARLNADGSLEQRSRC
jgi:uncharacterized delta-60 repeat protein